MTSAVNMMPSAIYAENLAIMNLHSAELSTKRPKEKDEDDADKWSRDILIAPPDFQQFKNDKDYSERSVVRFARDLGIAPGIVVGRMQREGMIKYSMLNDLKEKYEIAI